MKPAARLNEFGQSAWLDLIGRKLIHSGELARMAEEDGIRGVTANPAIFEKAIGVPISQIHSVANLFVIGVDTAVGKLLEEKRVRDLLGKIAVANAKEAYQIFLKSVASSRWKSLAARGATRQRPLWASTGTKNK